jgi:enamine deaminase RidA (YjgF/YER057c/UK114 family)
MDNEVLPKQNVVDELSLPIPKEVRGFGLPWEQEYGFAQAVKVGDTIYVSGQLSLDDRGNIVGAAPLDSAGRICDHSNMETQMRQTYKNAEKILGKFGATLDQVVEEVLYVTDMEKAFAAAGPVRKEAYGSSRPAVSSTIVVTPRLSLPTQLIEIKFIARLVGARDRSTSRSPP